MSDIEIKEICEKYKIENYTIKDGLVNVDGDVSLSNMSLIELPLKFGEVSGDFRCSDNYLTSLEGSPRYVGGDFFCGFNKLTDFKGCPDYVEGVFYCRRNDIYSLDGLLFKRIKIVSMYNNPIEYLYNKYNLADIDHREFLIEADVIRPPEVKEGLLAGRECVALPIINKDRMYWFTQTYGLEDFVGDKNYSIED